MSWVFGTAGWSIPRTNTGEFPASGTSLERYAGVFPGVEVNSSFHRSHRTSTWMRWSRSVPDAFRFAVKIPKTITHQAKLVAVDHEIAQFSGEVGGLGDKLAVLLVQLPPKLAFDAGIANQFFTALRRAVHADVVCEPRHPSWFGSEAHMMLTDLKVARAAADPAICPAAAVPGGWAGLAYWRLHGSPTIYRSSYGRAAIDAYAHLMRRSLSLGAETWCMFDNTAASAATGNAISLLERSRSREHGSEVMS